MALQKWKKSLRKWWFRLYAMSRTQVSSCKASLTVLFFLQLCAYKPAAIGWLGSFRQSSWNSRRRPSLYSAYITFFLEHNSAYITDRGKKGFGPGNGNRRGLVILSSNNGCWRSPPGGKGNSAGGAYPRMCA